jgi:hypothetical protein
MYFHVASNGVSLEFHWLFCELDPVWGVVENPFDHSEFS